ncbi:MAG: hypothetical protein M3Q19_08955 [Pseudomonadota bacterium]|nr:hypothetical protein [Pseudomonadota bacterium]
MSEHWNPDGEIARWTGADDLARPGKRSWPEGATAGLVLVAAGCLALGLVLYQFAGPRDVVEEVARR